MGLLDNRTHQEYYQGNDFGNYQFISLDDIISQFEIAYVGENKIIPKMKRLDISFYAQRALQELSFDTFKSIKSYQIDLPASLVMPLPHDYVNYTKLSWIDTSGIKHPLYPTEHTNNPFQINQDDSGEYVFESGNEAVVNGGFSNVTGDLPDDWRRGSIGTFGANYQSGIGISNNKLMWSYVTKNGYGSSGWGQTNILYQQIDTSNLTVVDLSADGITSDIAYTLNPSSTPVTGTAVSTIRLGLTTQDPSLINNFNNNPTYTYPADATVSATNPAPHPSRGMTFPQTPLFSPDFFDIGYIEWTGTENSTKTIESINLDSFDTVYVVALSFIEPTVALTNGFALKPSGVGGGVLSTVDAVVTGGGNINSLDNLSITNSYASVMLTNPSGNEKNSSTWNNYKSLSSSENNNDDYEDNTYWPMDGERYGLEPSHAQVNGSFFIDPRLGRIHFSSNISGKTVILDYISDSLGTDAEMQVHKFAEDAMYKWIAHAILSASSYGQALVPRLTKEKFAAVRKAKLRLSNIKLEELTQILRGKSKQIKH